MGRDREVAAAAAARRAGVGDRWCALSARARAPCAERLLGPDHLCQSAAQARPSVQRLRQLQPAFRRLLLRPRGACPRSRISAPLGLARARDRPAPRRTRNRLSRDADAALHRRGRRPAHSLDDFSRCHRRLQRGSARSRRDAPARGGRGAVFDSAGRNRFRLAPKRPALCGAYASVRDAAARKLRRRVLRWPRHQSAKGTAHAFRRPRRGAPRRVRDDHLRLSRSAADPAHANGAASRRPTFGARPVGCVCHRCASASAGDTRSARAMRLRRLRGRCVLHAQNGSGARAAFREAALPALPGCRGGAVAFVIPPLGLFVPTSLDLAGWMGAAFACLVFIGLGRLASGGRAAPEAALIAGWGAAVFVLTLWGLATQSSLRALGLGLSVLGLAALAAPRLRLTRRDWAALGRVIVLALPLLAVMASARPSLPDTWLNLLPNAAYLYDHGFFPADARPGAHSFIAGAPYNMQLAAFVASLVTPGFPPAAMINLNLLFQLAAGLLLARLAAAGGREDATLSWSGTALGILLATLLNPGFDPRYHLSAYSEPSVTVTLAFAGWFAARGLDRMNGGRRAGFDVWMLALALVALVNIKQESVLLVAGIVIAALALAAAGRAQRARRRGATPCGCPGLGALSSLALVRSRAFRDRRAEEPPGLAMARGGAAADSLEYASCHHEQGRVFRHPVP